MNEADLAALWSQLGPDARAEGGHIYLAFSPEVVGRDGVELNRIGALSGMDGIVAVLNRAIEARTGRPGTLTTANRVAKYVYDRVQAAYDGGTDAGGQPAGERTTFFQPAELLEIAVESGLLTLGRAVPDEVVG